METLLLMLLLSAGVSLVSTGAQMSNQWSMLESQQEFNSAEAEKSRDWASESARYNRMLDLGFNPDLAAASIMGNSQSVPYAASSPNAPQVPNMMEGLQRMLQQMPMASIEDKKVDADVRHTNLLSDKLSIENGFLPITLQQTVDYWNVYTDKLKTEHWIDYENWKVVAAQAEYAQPIAAQQYFQAVGTTSKIFTEAHKFYADLQAQYAEIDFKQVLKNWYRKDMQVKDSEILVNQTQADLNIANKDLSIANKDLSIANIGLVNSQTVVNYEQAKKIFQDAFSTFMDNQMKSAGEIYIAGDVMRSLVITDLQQDGVGQKTCAAILRGERELYDNQMLSHWKNYGKQFWMQMGDAVPNLIPSLYMGVNPYRMHGMSKSLPKSVGSSKKSNIKTNLGSDMSGKWKATWPSSGTVHEFYTTPKGKIYTE